MTTMTSKIAVLYCRSARKNDQSITDQEKLLRRYVAKNGGQITSIYKDNGQSGKHSNRPALKSMYKALKSGKANTVIVTDLARLARSPKVFFDIESKLEEYGASLMIVKSNQVLNYKEAIGLLRSEVRRPLAIKPGTSKAE